MEVSISFDNLDIVACYAAVLSTAIAVWEYIKWRKRNYIEVMCNANMIFMPSTDEKKYVTANVTNKGQTATTITHYALYYWPSWFDKLVNRRRQSFLVNSADLPKVLQPGEQWMGQAEQNDKMERMGSKGCLYAVIIHSMGVKETLHRVKIEEKHSSEDI